MQIKIKKLHPNATIPKYAKQGDAGMDLVATSKEYDNNGNTVYGTGLAFEIPEGYVGLLFPRSSNAKKDLLLSNSVGVLDSGYRGEVMFKFKITRDTYVERKPIYNHTQRDLPKEEQKVLGYQTSPITPDDYKIGDRIGQIIILPYPKIEFVEVEELSETERGKGGYGSSGN